jgi:hypothetical protein
MLDLTSAAEKEDAMKGLIALLTLGLGVAFVAPAFAADAPKTKAACAKMKDMKWDATTKMCVKK